MRSSHINWEELGIEASWDRRREPRIPLVFAIEVSGFDLLGKFFSEKTKTTNISESGCHFRLKNGVKPSGVVSVKVVCSRDNDMHGRRLLYQVVHAKQNANGWSVGVAKLQADSLWCVAFPGNSRNGAARAGLPAVAHPRERANTSRSELPGGESVTR